MDTTTASNLAYVGSKPTSPKEGRDSDAWFTPAKYIEAARAALGGHIDLDPFSDPAANLVVQASRIFTINDSALTQTWAPMNGTPAQTVWMNAPYGKTCREAVDKFLLEYSEGNFTNAIVLMNNATETKWFQALLNKASAMCLTSHRIAFYNIDGKAISSNTRGQAFLYFGDDPVAFGREFAQFGFVATLQGAHSHLIAVEPPR